MTTTNYQMWPYWREKYYNKVEALKAYYADVLAAELPLRLELIRIEAYEALIDKLMDALEDGRGDTDDGDFPMWKQRREDYGYEGALNRHYESELQKNEPLRVALQSIIEAEASIDKWMSEKASEVELDSE